MVQVTNELIMLLVIYMLVSVASFPDSSGEIDTGIVIFIWFSWALNGIITLYLIAVEIYSKARRFYLRRKANKKK